MFVKTTRNTEDFVSETGGWLAGNPVENSILLTMLAGAKFRPPTAPPIAWSRVEDPASDTAPVVGVAAFTPPHLVVLSGMPTAAAAALGAELGAGPDLLPGVIGPDAAAAAFAAAWSEATGRPVRADRRERILRLDGAVTADGRPAPDGQSRAAREEEAELFTDWCLEAAHGAGLSREMASRSVRGQIAGGLLRAWELDGEPVAILGRTAAVAGVVRYGPVYSRPDARRGGYARALLAESSAEVRAEGLVGMAVTAEGNDGVQALFGSLGYRSHGGLSEFRFD
ncbi:GNAT family N-acetyltransferase [Kitasatospora purpeofusca]|uniref:GNAT family N-acetyltransferase n=1 Tax=Kitasatospora purpeofusca TaxID=67352 RepID=UPI002A59DA48|nr:GNAT family N-acetyltransferase [Kitasatospora purpeofusca]MDY0813200.1 GNAT family N-acetyltransferase [Kitasatospora purpeofusca]